MYTMVQKSIFDSGFSKVFGIFVREPLTIHFVKEISRKINLAHTSVKKHLDRMVEAGLVYREKGERFFGYKVARDSEDFIFYKRLFNLMNLRMAGVVEEIKKINHFVAIVLYGSYLRGEDVEKSDIDLFLLSGSDKLPDFEDSEKLLGRELHVIVEKDLNNLSDELRNELMNGLVLDGYLKWKKFSK